MGPYAASKWAFEALSECLAQEMKAFNIRVAIVEPARSPRQYSARRGRGPKIVLIHTCGACGPDSARY
jgi:NAD(P)-dependent dehydrogenase (short-subunit alcohol dehydrogenase family)